MEVRKGYKQSEVGVIPEDWEVKSISEFSTCVRGGSPRPAGSPRYFNGDFIPWLTVAALTNISPSQLYVSETDTCLTEEGSHHSRTLEKETLIIANSGATLGVAKLLSIKCCANDGIAILLDFNKNIDKLYIVYFINSITKRLREVVATGNGQPNLNTDLIGAIKIPLPPTKSEQTAISTALSDADALITSLEKLIEKKRAIKQGAMQKCLNPDFYDLSDDTDLKPNQKNQTNQKNHSSDKWEVKKLGEIADILTGFPFPSSGYSKSGIRLLRGSNIKRGNTDWNEDICQYWPKVTAELLRYQLNLGDIVVAMDGSLVGKSFAQLTQIDLPAILLQRVARIRSTVIDINYLKELVCSEIFTGYCDSVKTSSAIPHISPSDIYNYPISYPSEKSEQTRIAILLSDMDAEITALEQKLSKYKQLKQGMMQELLTGRVRLEHQ